MKEHTIANQTDCPDDLVTNYKQFLKGETTLRRIESDTMPSELQRHVVALPCKRF